MWVLTAFFSFFVSCFPTGGGLGGVGTTCEDEVLTTRSISGSRREDPSWRDAPRVKYAGGSFPGFSPGKGLRHPCIRSEWKIDDHVRLQ
jgi:hypothetical protein